VPPAVRDDLARPRVDRADDRLRAELVGELADQHRLLERCAVHRDLVRAGAQQGARVLERRDPAADRERDLERGRRPLDELERRAAPVDGRGHVEEDELVRPELGVAIRELDRVADLPQPLEADALDDAAVVDVQARDQAPLDHRSTFRRIRPPAAPLRSGWNWTPASAPRSTAATTGPSCSTLAPTASASSAPNPSP